MNKNFFERIRVRGFVKVFGYVDYIVEDMESGFGERERMWEWTRIIRKIIEKMMVMMMFLMILNVQLGGAASDNLSLTTGSNRVTFVLKNIHRPMNDNDESLKDRLENLSKLWRVLQFSNDDLSPAIF